MIKLGYSPKEAADAVGGFDIFERMRKNDWVKPVVQGKRKTLYSAGDLARAWARLERGEKLPPLRKARS